MPTVDSATGNLVVRIAYDGAPLAGKTATLRALGTQLGADVASLDEAYGRTLWFDWMRYDGGLYDGSPIECEIVALPGQSALEERRRHLLCTADVVVFVADGSPAGQAGSRAAIDRYRAWLATRAQAPALVVQANKRDIPGAWDVGEARAELDLPDDVPVVATVATDRTGVRHAFIQAVGKAVRRAQEHRDAGVPLPEGPGPRHPGQLHHELHTAPQRAVSVRGTAVRGALGPAPLTVPPPPPTTWEVTW